MWCSPERVWLFTVARPHRNSTGFLDARRAPAMLPAAATRVTAGVRPIVHGAPCIDR
ncbi:hypothetical protein NFA_31380 [Nocardia farcinica IFM 10152]|uniref:Uncharacterized protein n=1 Tax=Nocardia farcinica (strain IFM 10152) TaxID=247156 RepID=Q5YV06_NOCFA|nr:hypothetical protein NFA_31380 [Nocardia farcinica IFM 10152]